MFIRPERVGTVEQPGLVPSKIIGIGVNYRKHAEAMGRGLPEEPLMFLTPRSSLLAAGGASERPGEDEWGELGVVTGRRARRGARS